MLRGQGTSLITMLLIGSCPKVLLPDLPSLAHLGCDAMSVLPNPRAAQSERKELEREHKNESRTKSASILGDLTLLHARSPELKSQ